jgi:hypothetical protein
MQANSTNQPVGVRAILHITPSTYTAALLSAQQRGLKLNEFLDAAIASACSATPEGSASQAPWGPHAMDLFLQLADTVPEAFRGPWKILYAKVLNDPSLWRAPQMTLDEYDASAGTASADWHINAAALTKAWPRLVASVFMC